MSKRKFCGRCLGNGSPGGCIICLQKPVAKTVQDKNLESIQRATHKEKRIFYSWVKKGIDNLGMTPEDIAKKPIMGVLPVRDETPVDPEVLKSVEKLCEKVEKEHAKKSLN